MMALSQDSDIQVIFIYLFTLAVMLHKGRNIYRLKDYYESIKSWFILPVLYLRGMQSESAVISLHQGA